MNMMTSIARGSDAAIDALRAEFGAILAARIMEAEAVDFLWEARLSERYLGQRIGWDQDSEEADLELSRIAIMSVLDGCWHTAECLVDGDGNAVELLWKRRLASRSEAEFELLLAR
ncbi:MAG TPA: hypothetical protein VEZ48_09740 [Sphingomonadaceae bacterium]|nr:hypothetical protein [Sphingomonadaceae bacterium]